MNDNTNHPIDTLSVSSGGSGISEVVLTRADIKEMQKMHEELEAENESLKKENEKLKERMAKKE